MRQLQNPEKLDEKLEEVAREVGVRWGIRMRAHYLRNERALGSWPGTLDEARRLIDDTVGTTLDSEERELLALLAERGARRAWSDVSNGGPPISSMQAISFRRDGTNS